MTIDNFPYHKTGDTGCQLYPYEMSDFIKWSSSKLLTSIRNSLYVDNRNNVEYIQKELKNPNSEFIKSLICNIENKPYDLLRQEVMMTNIMKECDKVDNHEDSTYCTD